jgi:hypothetical protein
MLREEEEELKMGVRMKGGQERGQVLYIYDGALE